MPKPQPASNVPPDQLTVNPIQAQRLASLTRLDPKELQGKTHLDLADRLKWILEPHFLLFRKICGRVVKKDPVTGALYPVPNATVHVQDTDCGLVAYFPPASKYGWFYPLFCHRETLATVKTDECGEFCVWIPRWDIDWILRWRKERFCFPFRASQHPRHPRGPADTRREGAARGRPVPIRARTTRVPCSSA